LTRRLTELRCFSLRLALKAALRNCKPSGQLNWTMNDASQNGQERPETHFGPGVDSETGFAREELYDTFTHASTASTSNCFYDRFSACAPVSTLPARGHWEKGQQLGEGQMKNFVSLLSLLLCQALPMQRCR
ncbi:mCG145445, partial [Mus musculus]